MPAIIRNEIGEWVPYDAFNADEVKAGRMTQEQCDSFTLESFDFVMAEISARAVDRPHLRYNWWKKEYEEY